jgi:pilus assembly protein CpaB
MDRNNRNIIIILAGGFLVAMLVALMVQSALKGDAPKEVDVATTEILVAAKPMKIGHEIAEGDLMWKSWPEDGVFNGAIVREEDQAPEDAAEGKLLRAVEQGQPIITTMVTGETGAFLSATVEKGMRAVGISVRSYSLADRLIRPGDYVDLLLTYRVQVNTRNNPEAQNIVNRYATETIIKNVQVLAIDDETRKAADAEEEEKGAKRKTGTNATLTVEVNPREAEYLMLASEMGDIGVALRSYGDGDDGEDDQTTTDVGMSRVLTTLSNLQQSTAGVRVYSGSRMTEMQARSNEGPGVTFEVAEPPGENPSPAVINAPPMGNRDQFNSPVLGEPETNE